MMQRTFSNKLLLRASAFVLVCICVLLAISMPKRPSASDNRYFGNVQEVEG